jgi:hypothetical protein
MSIVDPLERMHSDASGVPGPSPGGPEWLNSVGVVDRILREFGAEAIRRIGEPNGAKWVTDRAREMNATFLGHGYADPVIYATGPWNTPEFIGHNCITALRIDGEDREGPMLAMMSMAADMAEVVHANEEREPEHYAPELERILERTRNALLGLPVGEP